MKAIILAAGYATRLYPLTLDKPKPLLEIGGKPMIEYILNKIYEVDAVESIFIVTNHRFYKNFISWYKNYKGEKPLKIINDHTLTNDDRLGAVGDMYYVIREENIDDDLMVIAGDNLFDFSLKEFYSFFEKKNSSILALFDVKDKSKAANTYGVVEVDKNNKVVGFEEKPAKPKTSLAATACYLFKRKDMVLLKQSMENGIRMDNSGDFIKWLSENSKVYAFISNKKWYDIGSHEQLAEVRRYYGR